MEVFRAPRVTLIARPEFLEPEHLRCNGRAPPPPASASRIRRPDLLHEPAQTPGSPVHGEYLENIKKQGHGSVLEHAVSRAPDRKDLALLLARAGATPCGVRLSQLSQRYVDESHAAFVVRPRCWGTRHSNPSGSERWRTPRRRTCAPSRR